MNNLSDFSPRRAGRPYWLLLALALFLAGQIAVAAHWHNDPLHDNSSLDIDCALCALSSAASAALIPDALTIANIAFCLFIFTDIAREFISLRAFFYNSRAPPFYS